MKALSSILTICIIVGIVLASIIATSLWYVGIAGFYLPYGILDIVSKHVAIVVEKGGASYYLVILTIRNMGPNDVVIDNIFINDIPIEFYGNETCCLEEPLPVKLVSGEEVKLTIRFNYYMFTHGQLIKIDIHTSKNFIYPLLIVLP